MVFSNGRCACHGYGCYWSCLPRPLHLPGVVAHSFIHSFNHSFIHSFIHPSTYSPAPGIHPTTHLPMNPFNLPTIQLPAIQTSSLPTIQPPIQPSNHTSTQPSHQPTNQPNSQTATQPPNKNNHTDQTNQPTNQHYCWSCCYYWSWFPGHGPGRGCHFLLVISLLLLTLASRRY